MNAAFVATVTLMLVVFTTAESSGGSGTLKWLPPRLQHKPKDPSVPSRFAPSEAQYERFAACLAASGMSVSDFNELGREISQNARLKNKVIEQAYLYRMAAQFTKDPDMDDPMSRTMLPDQLRNRIVMFCESMVEIERLRADQRARLKQSLHVDEIPESLKISDESLKPFLSPKVRAVVEAFPLQAEEIVNRIGLESDEFNEMLEETRSNPAFRGLVESYMKRKVVKEFRANTGGYRDES